jgi:hypothetical protein
LFVCLFVCVMFGDDLHSSDYMESKFGIFSE